MSDATVVTPPAAAAPAAADTAPVLGGGAVETPAAPAAAAPVAAVPANANGTAPAVGQGQAEANAKAAAEKTAKDDANRKTLDDAAKAKDDEIAAKHSADKTWAEFKFKPPDGVTFDDKQLKSFAELARAEGLKPEQAQKFVDFQATGLKAQQAAAVQAGQAVRGRDLASLKSDPTLGGDKWDVSLRTANKALDKFGSPELKQYLATTLQDANPAIFRMLHAIGRAMADDSIADGAALGGRGTKPNPLEKLYPSMQKR